MHSPSRQPMASLPWLTSMCSLNTRGCSSTEFMRISVPKSQFISLRGRVSSAPETAESTSSQPEAPQ